MALGTDAGGRTPVPARTVIPKGTQFETFKSNVKTSPGQTLGFAPGKGYYAKGQPAGQGEAKNQTPFTRLGESAPSQKPNGALATITNLLTAPKAKPTGKPTSTLSPAQKAARDALAPLYADQSQRAQAQNDAIKNFSLAAMQALGPIAGHIQSDYSGQIGQQTQLMNNALAAIQGANPNQSDQALLSALGAPQAQKDALASQDANAFNLAGATGQYINSLPLSSLRSQGLAATTLARLQPSVQALRGQQALAGALLQQRQDRSKIDAMLPDLVSKYDSAAATQSARQQQLTLESQALGLKTQNQQFGQRATAVRLSQSDQRIRNQQDQWLISQRTRIDEFNARQSTANAKLGLPNNALSRSQGYLVDSRGNPILVSGKRQILPGFKAGPNGQVVKTSRSSTASTLFHDLTKTQVMHLRQGMNNLRFGTTDPKTNEKHPPVGYQEAIAHAVAEGYSRKNATRMANRFYPPGFNGRPAKPTPDRGFRDAKLK